jgi:hypothetical protein
MRFPLVLIATLACGCATLGSPLAPGADLAPLDSALSFLASTVTPGHDHIDATLHPGASWRIEEVFSTNLPVDGAPLSPASEFILHGNYAFVSLFHPSAGIVILDITDPTHPTQVGRFDSGTAYVNDVEVSPDGKWAFLPTSPIKTSENDPLGGGLPVLGDYGVQVVDVSDVKSPKLATFYAAPDPAFATTTDVSGGVSTPRGYHRLDLETIGGSLYVFGASLGYPRVDILRFEPMPVPRLVPVSVYVSDDARDLTKDRSSAPTGFGVHDVTVDPDPIEGFPLMAVSHWRSGAHFVDVRDPANPKFLGRFNDFGLKGGNVHNVEFTAIEGHRIAVAVPEYPPKAEAQGTIWIIDASDLAHPTRLANWSLPGSPPAPDPDDGTQYVYSTNRVFLRNGTLFDAHFHAGAIVLDISTLEKAASPELLGFVRPAGQARVPYATLHANPYVYDAIPRGEFLYYTDLTGGFHVARMAPEVARGNDWQTYVNLG